ncbi:type I-E CRISPR-associated protein Cas6/Cse3/CasE [Streptomyces sp. NPDC008317]|uniref:type I-E CRISPR-associated protein Cas6/Cse3/CasE n=1 Tax=Streptomyces sp. NPDC008317 TaxID=3364827 RepID=UPI0036EB351C
MSPRATLARIRLNPHNRDVQRDLLYAAEMHKTLMRMLPDHLGDTPRRDTGILYRVDHGEDASTLLVQATIPLDPGRLPAGYGRAETRDLTPMFTALGKQRAVRYRITVSPTKTERLPLGTNRKRGRIVPLFGADADQWWTRRAGEAGLHLHTTVATPQSPARSRPRAAESVEHSLIRFDGTATVTDPDALVTALLTGIGRGKPYGAGLLSLAPATAA